MKKVWKIYLSIFIIPVMFAVTLMQPVFAKQTKPKDRITSFKAFMAANKKALSRYEWIETTTVKIKDKEKSREQMRCYYGADGKLQKLPLTDSAPESKKTLRPVRRVINKMEEDKKRKLKEYIDEVVGLVRQYFPTDPVKIQTAKNAGKVSFIAIKPENTGRLIINDYLKSGDNLTFDINLKNNSPIGGNLTSYLDSNKDPVTMEVTFGVLNDGTSYASKTILDASKKELEIIIENSGYRKMAQ